MPKPDIRDQINSRKSRIPVVEDSDFEYSKSKSDRITQLPHDMLVEYETTDHISFHGKPQPFREYTQEELEDLAKSIIEVGVLEPVLVRPLDGKYQIIAGRHRSRACIIAGQSTVPCIVREMDDDTAALIMIHTNLKQRYNLLYSEKAFAYRMQMEIMNRQGQRTDLETLCNDCTKLDSLSEAGKKNNDSRRTVAYYIRLTYLLPAFLQMVDDEKLPMMTGVHFSYLSEEDQKTLLNWVKDNGSKISIKRAEDICNSAKKSTLTSEVLRQIFSLTPPPSQIKTFSVNRKKWKNYDDLIPNDNAGFDNLFCQFLDWLRENQNKTCKKGMDNVK